MRFWIGAALAAVVVVALAIHGNTFIAVLVAVVSALSLLGTARGGATASRGS